MPELKQYTIACREDWWPIHKATINAINETLNAGEIQRLKADPPKDPNGWMTADPLKRLGNVVRHVLNVFHHQKLSLLTIDTQINEWKHALCGLAIIAYHEAKTDTEGLVVEALDE